MIRKAVPYLVIVILGLVIYILAQRLHDRTVLLHGTQAELGKVTAERDQINLWRWYDKNEIGQKSKMIDSLRMALSIKPATIIRYVDRETVIHDTVVKQVTVVKQAEGRYLLADSALCWKWKGVLMLNPEPRIERTLFDYKSKEVDLYWMQYDHKFLFFKWGRKYYRKVIPQCGDVTVSEILIGP